MNTTKTLLEKEYTWEELNDFERDCFEAIEDEQTEGMIVKVVITIKPEHEPTIGTL